mgnify:CR=1 FL=1
MKKVLVFFAVLSICISTSVFAQTPKGKVKTETLIYDTLSYRFFRHIVIKEIMPKENTVIEFNIGERIVKSTVGVVKEINKKLEEDYISVDFYVTKKNGIWYLTDYYFKKLPSVLF